MIDLLYLRRLLIVGLASLVLTPMAVLAAQEHKPIPLKPGTPGNRNQPPPHPQRRHLPDGTPSIKSWATASAIFRRSAATGKRCRRSDRLGCDPQMGERPRSPTRRCFACNEGSRGTGQGRSHGARHSKRPACPKSPRASSCPIRTASLCSTRSRELPNWSNCCRRSSSLRGKSRHGIAC